MYPPAFDALLGSPQALLQVLLQVLLRMLLQPAELLKWRQVALHAGVEPDALWAVLKEGVVHAVRTSCAACAALALGCTALSARWPPFCVRSV